MTLQQYRELSGGGNRCRAIYMALLDGLVLTGKSANYISDSTNGLRYIRFIKNSKELAADGYKVVENWKKDSRGIRIKYYHLEKIQS